VLKTNNTNLRDTILISLAYFLLCNLLFIKLFSPNSIIYGTDTLSHEYIMNQFGWETFKNTGEIPLWNPYLFGGTPFLASFAFRPFYPVNWIFLFLPFNFALGYQYVINLFLAGIFFYYLCRCLNLSRGISFIAGFLFMFSGHLATLIYPGHFNKIGAIAFLPLAFGSFYKGLHSQERIGNRRFIPVSKFFIISGFALAMQLLSSHFQIFYYTVLLLFFYLIYFLILSIKEKRIGDRQSIPIAGYYPADETSALPISQYSVILFSIVGLIVCLMVAISISAIQLLPALELSQNSNRSGGITYDIATSSSFPPEELPEIIFPRFNGDSLIGEKGLFLKPRGDYNGRWKERIVSDYIGMVSFVFFFIGLFYSNRKERYFFLFILLFAAILSLGQFTPIFKFFYLAFPGIKTFRTPATIMVLMTLSITIISAFGLEKVLKSTSFTTVSGAEFTKKFFIFSLSLIIISLTLLYIGIRLLTLNNVTLNFKNIFYSASQTFFFLILTLLILFFFSISKKESNSKKLNSLFLFSIFLISFLDLSFNNMPFIQTTKFSDYKMFLYNDPIIQRIIVETQDIASLRPIRIIEIGNELTNRYMPSKITSIHGYHPIWLKDYKRLIDKLGFYNLTLFNLFNVKYIISRQPVDSNELVLKENIYGRYIYSLKHLLPYIYFPKKLQLFLFEKDNEEEVQSKILDELNKLDFTNSEEGIVKIHNHKKSLATLSDESLSDIKLINYSPDRIELSIDLKETCTMIISEVYEKNWKCFYNDVKKLEIYPANFLFRAVEVPAGKGMVSFVYDPLSYRIGKYISILGLIVFAIITVVSIKKS